MSPFLFSADYAVTELGQRARANTTVAEAAILSVSDLFGDYVEARKAGDKARMAELLLGADPALRAELDGFDYPAAA